jgi:hypothetical protein
VTEYAARSRKLRAICGLSCFEISGQVLLQKGDIPLLEAPLPTDLHSPKLSAPGQGIDRVGAQVELNGCLAAGKELVVEFSFVHVDHFLDAPPLDNDVADPA